MDVDFKQTSDVHINDKNEILPACMSAEITPYMLSQSYSFDTNESTSMILAELYGTNITAAEFMEKVYPGSLEVLPKDTVARLKKEPMVWPDPQKVQPGKMQMISAKSSGSDTVSIQTMDAVNPQTASTPETLPSLTTCTAETYSSQTLNPTSNPPNANFESYTKMPFPIKYTRVKGIYFPFLQRNLEFNLQFS